MIPNPFPTAQPLIAVVLTTKHYDTLLATHARPRVASDALSATPTPVSGQDFDLEALRYLSGRPAYDLVLPVTVGASRDYYLPNLDVQTEATLNECTPYAAARNDNGHLVTIYLRHQHPMAQVIAPGAAVPEMAIPMRRYRWDAGGPSLPTALIRAVAQHGTVVTLRQSAPPQPAAPLMDTNPLERV